MAQMDYTLHGIPHNKDVTERKIYMINSVWFAYGSIIDFYRSFQINKFLQYLGKLSVE